MESQASRAEHHFALRADFRMDGTKLRATVAAQSYCSAAARIPEGILDICGFYHLAGHDRSLRPSPSPRKEGKKVFGWR